MHMVDVTDKLMGFDWNLYLVYTSTEISFHFTVLVIIHKITET